MSLFSKQKTFITFNLKYMNRRSFLEKTAILGAPALLPLSSFSMFAKSKYKMGLQLYSINEDMTKETIVTLKALKALGYEDFETFSFDMEKGTYYGYKASEFKKILEDNNAELQKYAVDTLNKK